MAYKVTERRVEGGRPLILVHFKEEGIPVFLEDPWGNTFKTITGTKKQYGPGGFEFYTPYPVVYKLHILGEEVPIKAENASVYLKIEQSEAPEPLPEPVPEPELVPKDHFNGIPDWLGDKNFPGRLKTRPWTIFRGFPTEISGKKLTHRGVHWLPDAYHDWWRTVIMPGGVRGQEFWMQHAQEMGISFVTLLDRGGSTLQKVDGETVLELFLRHGIYPIIRLDWPVNMITPATNIVEFCNIYDKYGCRPIIQPYNEPWDLREWSDPYKGLSADRKELMFVENFMQSCYGLFSATRGTQGIYILIPDGPGFKFDIIKELQPLWTMIEHGNIGFAPHNYGLGLAVYEPYSAAAQFGEPIKHTDYILALDDFYDDPLWVDITVDRMNLWRLAHARPGLKGIDLGIGFMSWESVADMSIKNLGFCLPMFATETGWTPRDRAGATPETAILAYPLTTPNMVAKKTLAMYTADVPLIARNAWLIADDAMMVAGFKGWPFESWFGWAYSEEYGFWKPVVNALKKTEPEPIDWSQFNEL